MCPNDNASAGELKLKSLLVFINRHLRTVAVDRRRLRRKSLSTRGRPPRLTVPASTFNPSSRRTQSSAPSSPRARTSSPSVKLATRTKRPGATSSTPRGSSRLSKRLRIAAETQPTSILHHSVLEVLRKPLVVRHVFKEVQVVAAPTPLVPYRNTLATLHRQTQRR